MMECDICARTDFEHVGLYCASCARNTIYLARLEGVRAILEKEALGHRLELEDNSGLRSGGGDAPNKLAAVWTRESNKANQAVARDRLQTQRAAIASLRESVSKMKEEAKQRRTIIDLRRKELDSVKVIVPGRQRGRVNRVVDISTRGNASFDSIFHKSVETRAYLCREAAVLLRMRQRKRQKLGVIREQYFITGLMVPDLKDINNIRCADLTAVLTGFSHLLVLVAFYLGVRLPAEITLPHRDYPLATINTPATSYQSKRVPFPGSGSALSLPGSPSASRQDVRSLPRPRPLFIGSDDREEKVAQIARKDPIAFNFFLEAVSLLAWNTSWLIHMQGFSVGTESWEDACNIGRNLWKLIFGPQEEPKLPKMASNQDLGQRGKKPSENGSVSSSPNPFPGKGRLGEQSHSSAHNFPGATRKDLGRGLKLSKYTMIADPLKKTLVTEMNNAEWELLDDEEVDDGGERFDEAVFIKTRTMDGKGYDDARSIMTTRTIAGVPEADVDTDQNETNARARGKSGWTKVKNRENTT